MAQQTAVEWFTEQSEKILIDLAKNNNTFQLELCLHGLNELEVQAKQMEREQHDVTFTAGYDYRSSKEKDIIEAFGINSKPTFEQYYTQIYGNNQNK